MVFYVKISNALFEEKQQLDDQDFAWRILKHVKQINPGSLIPIFKPAIIIIDIICNLTNCTPLSILIAVLYP